ncbi:Eukaryotic initiation factor 4A-II [Tupaia chinensis]|uniref:RNA helicase n=1 Tax=Tupaia chinensis TaxID=246437 RepID=L9L1B9_TUPCH|nr:Eukaryotic initiation factor 4A-II [Tupaia chinensis]
MDPDSVIESNWNESVDNFDDMNLKDSLLQGIYGYGFEKRSAIQQRAVIPCIKGYDVIAQAQSALKNNPKSRRREGKPVAMAPQEKAAHEPAGPAFVTRDKRIKESILNHKLILLFRWDRRNRCLS